MMRFSLMRAAPGAAAAVLLLGLQCTARAQTAADAAQPADELALPAIVVTAQHLDEVRSHIQTQTGASTYTVDAATIAQMPAGDNTLLNQVVLQMPEVAQDSFGQFHIRGEHNGLQYRINGIILPEGISVFGQALDPRFVSSMSLIDGALPAEYGLRTAGIIDITTKSGLQAPGGAVSLYGGSHGEIEPSFNYGGSAGAFNYFVTGDFLRNDLGIESPDGSSNPIHDHTTQYHGFGYFEDILDEENRGRVHVRRLGRQVSDSKSGRRGALVGLERRWGHDVSKPGSQRQSTRGDRVRGVELAAFGGSAQRSDLAHRPLLEPHFRPGAPVGDLLFTGIAQNAFKQDVAYAAQSDASYELNPTHTIRGGLFIQSDHAVSDTTSQVLLTDEAGMQISDVPVSIVDNGSATEWIYSGYLQDEWKLEPNFTVNYGLRWINSRPTPARARRVRGSTSFGRCCRTPRCMPAIRATCRRRPSSWSAARISPCS